MKKLEDHIAPGEAVVWRSPTIRDWAKDHAMTLVWAAGAPGLIGFVSSGWSGLAGLAVGLVFALGLAARQLAAGPTEALLTGRQLLFREGLWQPATRIFERRDIARLEIFGGDGTLVLSGRRDELFRHAVLGDPMAIARHLDVPTTLWKPYEPPKRVWRVDMVGGLMFPAFLLGLVASLVFLAPDSFWGVLRSLTPEKTVVTAIALGVGFLVATAIPSALVAAGAWAGMRRLLLPRDELNRMRCYKFNPLWRGRNPATVATSGPRGAILVARMGFDLLMNGPFPDCGDIEPERYEPGAFPPPEEGEEG